MRRGANPLSVFAIFLVLFLSFFSAFAQQPEQISVVTYYPSPYANYAELRAKRIAVGNNYINLSSYCWPGGSCPMSGRIDADASLIVEGSVGIGTINPGQNKLGVVADSANSNGVRIYGDQNHGYSQLYLVTSHNPNPDRYFIDAHTTGSGDAQNFYVKHNGDGYFKGSVIVDGSAGIGRSPEMKLDVSGGIRTSTGSGQSGHLWVEGSDAGIELRWPNGTPYIDFSGPGAPSADYDGRIILANSDELRVDGASFRVHNGAIYFPASESPPFPCDSSHVGAVYYDTMEFDTFNLLYKYGTLCICSASWWNGVFNWEKVAIGYLHTGTCN